MSPRAAGELTPDDDSGADEAVVTEVARRYYLADESKVAIASAMGLSRFQVARLLTSARERGIVRIEIGRAGRVDHELGQALSKALGLTFAVVLDGLDGLSFDETAEHVGGALAELLAQRVGDGETLGLSYSRTIAAMARRLRQIARCDVVQLAGHLTRPGERSGSPEIVRQVAAVSGGTAHPIYCPMLVADPATADALRAQPEIAQTLARAGSVDRAVVSIGAWAPGLSGLYEVSLADERDAVAGRGVRGEVTGRLYDARGRSAGDGLDDRIVAITLAQLRRIDEVIGVCFDAERADSAAVAARAGLVDVLVTDGALARRALERVG